MKTDKNFKEAIQNQRIPILVLDHKWHQLMERLPKTQRLSALEQELNDLLKQQGKANTELKQYKQLKKKLMDEIVSFADDALNSNSKEAEKNIEKNKYYMNECNEKIDFYEDQLLELPKKIDESNRALMLETMNISYDSLKANESLIDEIGRWISAIRIELKKKLVRKQEKELVNKQIYAFMHNVFGPNVIDLFDMEYLDDKDGEKQSSEKEKES